MNALAPFDFEGRAVRVVEDAASLPWFVALDVCEALGLGNNRQVVARLDEDERANVTIVDTSSSTRGSITALAVNEAGLYSLILTSRKPEAKRFKRWITHEVLPALRRTGRYEAPSASADPPPLPAAPQHRADAVVSATRSLTALIKAGMAVGLSRAQAALRANQRTLELTGVDLAEMMHVDLLSAAQPRGIAHVATDPCVQQFIEDWRSGVFGPAQPVPFTALYNAYEHRCRQQGRAALSTPHFGYQAGQLGVAAARKRWRQEGVIYGPHSFLYPQGLILPPHGTDERDWLGHCAASFMPTETG